MKRVYKKSFIKLEVDQDSGLMIQTWLTFCTPEEFRKGQLETVAKFEEFKCKHFISNATKAGALPQEETDWAAEVISPALHKLGMPCINFVIPENKFAVLAIKNLVEKNQERQNVPFKYFPSVEEAIKDIFE
jgi:hypothetical protein